MSQWLTGGWKVCANTSCVVGYTMGGCVSCGFTRWNHGSKGTTWREYWFAYKYSDIPVGVKQIVFEIDEGRRVVLLRVVKFNYWGCRKSYSIANRGCRSRYRESVGECEIAKKKSSPTREAERTRKSTRSRLPRPMRTSRPRVRSEREHSE